MRESQYINFVNINNKTNFPYFVMDEQMKQVIPEKIRFHIMHYHDDFQFNYVLQGKLHLNTLTDTIAIEAGQGLFINKQVLHQLQPEAGARYITIRFEQHLVEFYQGGPAGKYIKSLAESGSLPFYHFSSSYPWEQQTLGMLQQLIALEQDKSSVYEYEVLTLLSCIWLAMLKNITVAAAPKESRDAERMAVFLAYIEKHYAEDIALEELAASANVSKSECLRSFRKTMQITPYRYLLEYRLAQADYLLTETDLPIGEIALRVGFNQISYFGKCFKAKTGLNPREYRKEKQ